MLVVLTIVIISIVIVVHELGHFLTAVFFKTKVLEFSIGMGPKIFGYNKFSIRLLPLGGYVKLDEESLENTSKPRQIVIMLAGIFMNFLLAYILILYFSKFDVVKAFVSLTGVIYKMVEAFLHITGLKDLSGPIGIHSAVVSTTKALGIFKGSAFLLIIISINLGIINLLPIPGLDGSRIYLTLIKMVGVKIDKKLEEKIYVIGFLFLITLTIIIMIQDVFKYIWGV